MPWWCWCWASRSIFCAPSGGRNGLLRKEHQKSWRLSPRIFPVDVVVQLLDGLLLRGDDPLHQVADGKHARHMFALEDRQMTDAVVGHDAHAILDGVAGGYRDQIG